MPSRSRIAIWAASTRPRTLPVAVAPVLCGSALAWHYRSFNGVAAALCLGFALLSQIAANFANDYYDFVKGADTAERVGPKRSVASGLIAPTVMKAATLITCAVAFCLGLCLIPYGGWPLIIVGLCSLVCAVAYTGGPYPLGYHGLGDLFVFIFFGPVAVITTFFVQTGTIRGAAVPPAIALGLLAANVLVANNLRDQATDSKAGKRTLVVRYGRGFALWQFSLSHLFALACPFVLHLAGYSLRGALLPLFVVLAIWGLRQLRVISGPPLPERLIPLLGDCGRYILVYSVVLSLTLA